MRLPPFYLELRLPANAAVERAAVMLRSGLPTAILIAGNALYGNGLLTAGRIAAATGATLLAPYPITRLQRGEGFPRVDRVQYVLEQGIEQFKEFRQLILVGTQAPVAYFAYPGKDSAFTSPDCRDPPTGGAWRGLRRRARGTGGSLVRCRSAPSVGKVGASANALAGKSLLPGLAAAVGALLPENVIVVDESMTSGRGLMAATKGAPPHDWLGNTGGAIGIALPLAVGAAVACPDRKVLCLTADGSGMYTLQALWTMAREGLNVTTVVFANRDYAVLKREFSYLGVGNPGHAGSEYVRDRPSQPRLGPVGQRNGSTRHPGQFAGSIREGVGGGIRRGRTNID